MTEVLRQLANGKTMRFDDAKTPPDVIDRVVAYEDAKFANDNDSTGGVIDKSIRTVVRGTGEGIASTLDMPHVAGHWLGQVAKNAWEESQGRPYERTSADWPITDVYNENIAAPVEPGYERMNDITAMVAPAVIESAITMGTGAPAAIAQMAARTGLRGGAQTARQIAGATGRTAGRAATTTAVGAGGAYGGGELGSYVGGDVGREIGAGLGGLFAGAVSPTAKTLLRSLAFEPDSADTLNALNRLNRPVGEGGADANIPLTAGLLSPKRLGAMEDQLARQPIIGRRVIETRRGQYEGIDRAKQNIIERIRGGPAGGPITKESLGMDIRNMLADTSRTIDDRISTLQEGLAQNVGLMTPTDAMHIERTLNALARDRTTSAGLRDQASQLRDQIRRDYQLLGPEDSLDVPTPTAPYGATKDIRSRVGNMLPETGLDRKVEAPAYRSLTDMMREAAESRGVSNFDEIQTETGRLADQRTAVNDMIGEGTDPEATATSKLVGGGSKGSVQQLAPHREHNPQTLDQILADALELNTRGPNAGRPVDPELVDPKAMTREWSGRSDEFQNEYTGNNPTSRRLLDDVTTVSQAEASRAGKRSVPGGPGSTIGEGLQNQNTGLRGGLLFGIPGFVLEHTIAPLLRQAKSNLLTNENGIQRVFRNEPAATTAGRAAAGAATGANIFINDPGGEGHGAAVTPAPDQSNVPAGMKRVVMPDGTVKVVGDKLLTGG